MYAKASYLNATPLLGKVFNFGRRGAQQETNPQRLFKSVKLSRLHSARKKWG